MLVHPALAHAGVGWRSQDHRMRVKRRQDKGQKRITQKRQKKLHGFIAPGR